MPEVKNDSNLYELNEIIKEVSSWGNEYSFEEEIASTPIIEEPPTSNHISEAEKALFEFSFEEELSSETLVNENPILIHDMISEPQPESPEQTAPVSSPQDAQTTISPETEQEELDAETESHFADFLKDSEQASEPSSQSETEQAEPETVKELFSNSLQQSRAWFRKYKKAIHFPTIKVSLPHVAWGFPQFSDKHTPPSVPIKELQYGYRKESKSLRTQSYVVALFTSLLMLLAYATVTNNMIFPSVFSNVTVILYSSLSLFILSLVFSKELLIKGLKSLLLAKFGAESLCVLSSLFVIIDTLFVTLSLRPYSLPLFAPVSLILFFQLWGLSRKKQAQYYNCQTVSISTQTDCLTMEYHQWGEKPLYRRRSNSATSFSSQMQQKDGAELIFEYYAPFFLFASVFATVITSIFHNEVTHFFYLLSAFCTISCSLSMGLCFSFPFYRLSRRLRLAGVALAGWSGVHKTKNTANLLVKHSDLFPSGSMQLNNYRLFGNAPSARVISYTTSVLKAVGSDLHETFSSLARIEGAKLLHTAATTLEDEGASAIIDGAQVFVGNAAYMKQKGIYQVPSNLEDEEGLFCAINDRLVGFFSMEYHVHHSVSSALGMLFKTRIIPILGVIDFAFTTKLFRTNKRFTRIRFTSPSITERHELLHKSSQSPSHLVALINRNGLEATTTAILSATRLQYATYLSAFIACLSSFIGIALILFLSIYGSYFTFSAIQISMYLLLWSIPTFLITHWIDQF